MIYFLKKRVLTSFILVFVLISLCAQKQDSSYILPLKLPVSFSGNFAEIRGSHFHAGLDFKTQQTPGHKVYAVKDGVVARVAVSLTGYGWVIYINHPDGFTSVYGHLSKFNEEITKIIKQIQYQKQTFTLDEDMLAYDIQVKQNEVIAYSGNTGGSQGPHLHFELRNTATERPQNVLRSFFGNLPDSKFPVIKGVMVYADEVQNSYTQKFFPVYGKGAKFSLKYPQNPIEVYGGVSFGIEANDYISGSSNKCGIYSLRVLIDGVVVYEHKMDELDFTEARCVHSFVDYAYRQKVGRKVQRTHVDPNNHLGVYVISSDDYLIDTLKHRVVFEVRDAHNNLSTTSLWLKGKVSPSLPILPKPSRDRMLAYDREADLHFDNLSLSIPAFSFFTNQDSFGFNKPENYVPRINQLSPVYELHSPLVPPLKKEARLAILQSDEQRAFAGKVYWGIINKNSVDALSTQVVNDSLVANMRFFGDYALFLDTVPPVVELKNFVDSQNVSALNQLQLTISDAGTGIATYSGYIDEQWVLFEYEPKLKMLYFNQDKDRVNKEGSHSLRIRVADHCGNVTEKNYIFFLGKKVLN